MIRFLLIGLTGIAGLFVAQKTVEVYGPFLADNQASIDAQALALAKAEITRHEGRRADAYYDTEGFLTVGIGHKVLPGDNIRHGQRISEARIDAFFEADIQKAFAAARLQARELNKYDPVLIAALTSVNFQLGTGWRGKFTNTWNDLKRGNVASAIQRLRVSLWAKQTPQRTAAFISALERTYA